MKKSQIVMINDPLADAEQKPAPVMMTALFQITDIFSALPADQRANVLLSTLAGFLINEASDPFVALDSISQACHARLHAMRGSVPSAHEWSSSPVHFTGAPEPMAHMEPSVTISVWRGLLVLANTGSMTEAAVTLSAIASVACLNSPDPADTWSRIQRSVEVTMASQPQEGGHG